MMPATDGTMCTSNSRTTAGRISRYGVMRLSRTARRCGSGGVTVNLPALRLTTSMWLIFSLSLLWCPAGRCRVAVAPVPGATATRRQLLRRRHLRLRRLHGGLNGGRGYRAPGCRLADQGDQLAADRLLVSLDVRLERERLRLGVQDAGEGLGDRRIADEARRGGGQDWQQLVLLVEYLLL